MCHYVQTGDAHPVKRQPRRLYPQEQRRGRREIEQMLEGLIEPSETRWACQPIMANIVLKHDGSIWYCINYEPLDNLTVEDSPSSRPL